MLVNQVAISSLSLTRGVAEAEVCLAVGYKRIQLAHGMCSIAGPSIIGGLRHHLGPYGVQFYVAIARQQVTCTVDQAGPIASLPERTRALLSAVHVINVPTPQTLHGFGNPVRLVRCHEQVDMVGHEDVGVDVTLVLCGSFA